MIVNLNILILSISDLFIKIIATSDFMNNKNIFDNNIIELTLYGTDKRRVK
jgi:hypothetical protein